MKHKDFVSEKPDEIDMNTFTACINALVNPISQKLALYHLRGKEILEVFAQVVLEKEQIDGISKEEARIVLGLVFSALMKKDQSGELHLDNLISSLFEAEESLPFYELRLKLADLLPNCNRALAGYVDAISLKNVKFQEAAK